MRRDIMLCHQRLTRQVNMSVCVVWSNYRPRDTIILVLASSMYEAASVMSLIGTLLSLMLVVLFWFL
jgi:hypothetical protein